LEGEGKRLNAKVQNPNVKRENPNVKAQMTNDNELVGCISLIGFIG
jgi:hypothetical protein